jgi:hypothetical protein
MAAPFARSPIHMANQQGTTMTITKTRLGISLLALSSAFAALPTRLPTNLPMMSWSRAATVRCGPVHRPGSGVQHRGRHAQGAVGPGAFQGARCSNNCPVSTSRPMARWAFMNSVTACRVGPAIWIRSALSSMASPRAAAMPSAAVRCSAMSTMKTSARWWPASGGRCGPAVLFLAGSGGGI